MNVHLNALVRTALLTKLRLSFTSTVALVALGLVGEPATALPPHLRATHNLQGVHVFGWGFNWPRAVTSEGGHVWIACRQSVVELDTKTGRFIREVYGSSYRFNDPVAIASYGGHVFVSNQNGDSITELGASTGRLVRVIADPKHRLIRPGPIAVDRGHVWASIDGGHSIAEIDASWGGLIRILSGPRYHFDAGWDQQIASDGKHVWTANASDDSVTELSASTGRLIRIIKGSTYSFHSPSAVAVSKNRVWVGSCCNHDEGYAAGGVTELNASSGKLVKVISGSSYQFMEPKAISANDDTVWVVNFDGNSVTEFRASTGSLIRVISGPPSAFNYPNSIVLAGGHLWVTNGGFGDSRSVTELRASTGRLVQLVYGSRYGFSYPDAIASDGQHVWVANQQSYTSTFDAGSVTEMSNATGRPVRTVAGPAFEFNHPSALTSDGAYVWVANFYGNSVTRFSASTDDHAQVMKNAPYWFFDPNAITSAGTHIWVTNAMGENGSSLESSVTELDEQTGGQTRVISGSKYRFAQSVAIASDGRHVWVANSADGSPPGSTDSVTELNASTGDLVRVLSGPKYHLNRPQAIASDGRHVWVVNAGRDVPSSVTELDASTGAAIRLISGSAYAFNGPDAIASDGTHVWVVNALGETRTYAEAGSPSSTLPRQPSTECSRPVRIISAAPPPSPWTGLTSGWPTLRASRSRNSRLCDGSGPRHRRPGSVARANAVMKRTDCSMLLN